MSLLVGLFTDVLSKDGVQRGGQHIAAVAAKFTSDRGMTACFLTAVILCVHGVKHFWDRLAWVFDVAKLITVQKVDWVLLPQIAAEMKSTRVTLLGLYLANDLFGRSCRIPFWKKFAEILTCWSWRKECWAGIPAFAIPALACGLATCSFGPGGF